MKKSIAIIAKISDNLNYWDGGTSKSRSAITARLSLAVTLVVTAGCANANSVPAIGVSCMHNSHGGIALNPHVTKQTIAQAVCVVGYTWSVRPATDFTWGTKAKLIREANLDETQMSSFELDHIVPLALGGHPRKCI